MIECAQGYHQDGGRLALLYIIRYHMEISMRGVMRMNIEDLMAVISFAITCFSIGYAIGRNHIKR